MKIDRLIGIITYLLQHDKITAPQLAKRFEVSRRTILRDIDTLSLAGIPIVTTQGGDGGISIMDGYKLDKNLLTPDELSSIIAGLKSLGSVSKTTETDLLISKLSPSADKMISLQDHIIIDLSSYYKDSLAEKITLIKKAITDRKLVSFDYYYAKGESSRTVEPYYIKFQWTNWYLFGYCCERKDFRTFKLNRLWGLVALEENFAPREVPPNRPSNDDIFSEPHTVKLLFDRSARFHLIETYGLHCYTDTENGLLLEVNYTNRDHILRWVLAFGDSVTVLSPDDFRDEVTAIALKMVDRYR